MDWLPDFRCLAKQDKRIETLKADKFRGKIEIDFDDGSVKVVKVQSIIRAI
jgi:hypothetical protein